MSMIIAPAQHHKIYDKATSQNQMLTCLNIAEKLEKLTQNSDFKLIKIDDIEFQCKSDEQAGKFGASCKISASFIVYAEVESEPNTADSPELSASN